MKTKTYSWHSFITALLLLLLLLLCSDYTHSTPMMYKKNNHQKYEADLVPVSSTVIPLTVLEVSYGLGGKPSEEYKMAYLKKLNKKFQHQQRSAHAEAANEQQMQMKPDALITIKKKQRNDNQR